MMLDVEEILTKFQGLSLDELDQINLSDRQDSKSVFSEEFLPDFLNKLLPYYKILDMNGRRNFQYESVYFDTPELKSYTDHQRGKARRHKFRFRRYVDCGDSFFEIKLRNGKGRNLKTRIPAESGLFEFTPVMKAELSMSAGIHPDELTPSLRVTVNRITLLHKNKSEKATFDFNIRFELNGKSKRLPNLVIAEVKQMRHNLESEFFKVQRKLGIYPVSFSKYCIGIATLHDNVKKNNFKQSLMRIRKIIADQ